MRNLPIYAALSAQFLMLGSFMVHNTLPDVLGFAVASVLVGFVLTLQEKEKNDSKAIWEAIKQLNDKITNVNVKIGFGD